MFNIPKTSAINVIDGTAGILVADSALIHNRSMMTFNILHYWWDSGVEEDQVISIEVVNNKNIELKNRMMIHKSFIKAGAKTILILNDSSLLNKQMSYPHIIDYVVISKNSSLHLDDLQKKIHFRQLIIDSSNSKRRSQRWQEEAKRAGVLCYSVIDQGAFVVHFR